MFDILDLMKPHQTEVLSGNYREFRDSEPRYFEYSVVNYPSRKFTDLINNLITTGNSLVIKTTYDNDFAVNGFVYLQDGKAYNIIQIQKDNKNSQNLRILLDNPQTEFILALQEISNARGIL